jgi:hypothetical protein
MTVAAMRAEALDASAGQSLAEGLDQVATVLFGATGQVEVDHRGVDLLMAQEFLDGVDRRPPPR